MYKERIETADLILAKAKMSDLEDLYQNYWSQSKTAKFMLWKPAANLDEAHEKLRKTLEWQKDRLSFTVYEKESGQAIGLGGMKEIAPQIYEDAGIGIGTDFVRKGYGKQILTAFIDCIFGELGGQKIICSCDSRNIAAVRLFQSCGLKYTHSAEAFRERDNEEFVADFFELEK